MARLVVAGGINGDEVVRAGAAAPDAPRLGGGAANAAVALMLAGHRVAVAGVVGRDALGADLVATLRRAGVDVRAVRRAAGPTTRMRILLGSDGERTIVRLGPHRAAELSEADIAAAGGPVDGMFVKAFSAGLAAALAGLGDRAVTVAEFPPPEFGHAWPVHTLVGSRSALPPEVLADPFGWGRRRTGTRLRLAVVTHGASGAVAYDGHRAVDVPPVPVRQVDATGAGDAFAAGLLHGLVQAWPVERVLAAAAAWGALAAASDGSVLPESAGAILRRL